MEHPLIANLENLSIEQLSDQITQLHKKLGIAARTGNGHMCDQLRMAIESYQNQYQVKTRRDDGATPFEDVIDIS
jgi:hypothetical protein